MKSIKLFFAGLTAVMLVSSCGMMNDGFSGSSIQKRKYTKGFYLSKNKSWSKESDEAKSEKLEEDIFVKDQVVILNEETNTPFVIKEQTQTPVVKKNEKTDQSEDQKSVQKKDESKKVMTSEKKTSVPAPSKQRKERVPERYLPMKKAVVENRNQAYSSNAMDDFQLLCIILTILIPFVGVAVYTNLDVTKTLICLLLTLLFYVPGLIYGLLVVLDKI